MQAGFCVNKTEKTYKLQKTTGNASFPPSDSEHTRREKKEEEEAPCTVEGPAARLRGS